MILILILIVMVRPYIEVAVSPAVHVLLLSYRTLDIGPSRNVCVRHIKNAKTGSVLPGQGQGYFAPIALHDPHFWSVSRGFARIAPAPYILERKAKIAVGRAALLELGQSLAKYTAPLRAFRASKATHGRLNVRAKSSTNHAHTFQAA
jgi:hypothetical protein